MKEFTWVRQFAESHRLINSTSGIQVPEYKVQVIITVSCYWASIRKRRKQQEGEMKGNCQNI